MSPPGSSGGTGDLHSVATLLGKDPSIEIILPPIGHIMTGQGLGLALNRPASIIPFPVPNAAVKPAANSNDAIRYHEVCPSLDPTPRIFRHREDR